MNNEGQPYKKRNCPTTPYPTPTPPPPLFNDRSTADVLLSLHTDPPTELTLFHLHSHILTKSNYFSTLLSPRWLNQTSQKTSQETSKKPLINLSLTLSPHSTLPTYTTVFNLLYSSDVSKFEETINSVETAITLMPVALELLFEECVKYCVQFIEGVPWNDEEEMRILNLVPFLNEEESGELLARVWENGNGDGEGEGLSPEEMLHGLITNTIHSVPNMAFAKSFVAKLFRDLSSRENARRVLNTAFSCNVKVAREAMEEYSSPNLRGDHNETEAIQRLNLHTAMTSGRHLLWLAERMIELRVANGAVEEWSEQASLTADLQRAFRDDAWRNIVPGLPTVVLRCTCKLANAMTAGVVLAPRQVRLKFVKDWLPVLIVCRDNGSPMVPGHTSLYLELEKTFLQIISTLPMRNAQELLLQCLSFSTRNVEDCPHLFAAFKTWFRRANRHLGGENPGP